MDNNKGVLEISEPALTVLFEIASSVNTPKQIALSLDKSPPAIMKQLNWLREMGWIKRGEKRGKLQQYIIDWNKILIFFLRKAPKLNYLKETTKLQYFPTLASKLSQNERFKQLFIFYIMERYKSRRELFRIVGFDIPLSVPQFMENFEDSMIYLLPQIQKKAKTSEDKELLKLLKEWKKNAEDYIPPNAPLKAALKKMDLI
ncbi:MAG: ArsR family transcriptional regulator [Candidatus Bathyarchaeota archaeon]|nr:MAG: ArsR family transcriptional regulator [Candidatus Bathyarchaeota archaeon]